MIIILVALVWVGYGQQLTQLTQPPWIETNKITITNLNTSDINFQTTITFIQSYPSQPLVYLSLVDLRTLQSQSNSTLLQYLQSIGRTSCQHQLSLQMSSVNGTTYSFVSVQLIYLAYDYSNYPYIQLYDITVQVPNSRKNQFLMMDYLPVMNSTSLSQNNSYNLNVLMTGYKQMILSGTPSIYLDAAHYDNNSYLLNIKRTNLTVRYVQILRVLIDQTLMMMQTSHYNDLLVTVGSIVHIEDPMEVQNNATPDFLPFAMLYGIKGWLGFQFDLPSLTYIFNNSYPRVQVKIGYVLFQTKNCPSNQLYVAVQNLCYGLSASFYYQLTAQTMAPCPYSCYKCVGPLSTNCRSCVDGWNRYLQGGQCICIFGFYDTGDPICKNCTQSISGCQTCSDGTNCLTCLPGCTVIGFNPIYCDCPNHIQSNYSYNCPLSKYYQHDTQQCQCKPQTYLDRPSGYCFPCELGCYICVSAEYCLLCIDSYRLINRQCVFYHTSFVLMGKNNSLDSPEARCLTWSGSVCIKRCQLYYVQFQCFGGCPGGTFPITQPWLTCQPCKISCVLCYNLTVCYQCITNYFYFNRSTFACDKCSPNCQLCLNASYCTQCKTTFILTNNSCLSTQLAVAVCPSNCQYCRVSSQCLICSTGFYLNSSDYQCYGCVGKLGYSQGVLGDCVDICGNGVLGMAECDDGNTQNGDGCSRQCSIQPDFQCKVLNGRSYCWNQGYSLNWQIYNTFGKNQIVVEVSSQGNLQTAQLQLYCNFEGQMKGRQGGETVRFKVDYAESIVLPSTMSDEGTSSHVKGTASLNRCYIQINSLFNYTVVINPVPQPLLVDYNYWAYGFVFSEGLLQLLRILVFVSMGVLALGICPSGAFVSVRIAVLMLAMYLDYYQMPINSFSVYNVLEGLLAMGSSSDTRELVTFDVDHQVELLWGCCTIYGGVILIQDGLIRLVCKFVGNTHILSKIWQHMFENRNLTYLYFSSAYQLLTYNHIFGIILNLHLATLTLIAPSVILILLLAISKAHFFMVSKSLKDNNPYLWHSVVVDQLTNPIIAILIQLSIPSISFTPITILLFASYSFLSIVMADSSNLNPQFRISQTIAAYQYAVGLAMVGGLQLLKCGNMWNSSLQGYEDRAIGIGATMAVIGMIMLLVNGFMGVVIGAIKCCQIRYQKSNEVEEATVENASAQQWSVTS